jgi:DNA-binding LytR/AlgR family response regulator
MIKITNIGVQIAGHSTENSAELTMLLNTFYRKCKERVGEEQAMETLSEIATIALSGNNEPHFESFLDIEISAISGVEMRGSSSDVKLALGVIAGIMYRQFIEHTDEDTAKEWLVFIGHLAVMSDEELASEASQLLS